MAACRPLDRGGSAPPRQDRCRWASRSPSRTAKRGRSRGARPVWITNLSNQINEKPKGRNLRTNALTELLVFGFQFVNLPRCHEFFNLSDLFQNQIKIRSRHWMAVYLLRVKTARFEFVREILSPSIAGTLIPVHAPTRRPPAMDGNRPVQLRLSLPAHSFRPPSYQPL